MRENGAASSDGGRFFGGRQTCQGKVFELQYAPMGDFCSYCYRDGAYTYECDLDDMIESCVPFMTEKTGMLHDEAVSLMGAMLPTLKRWKEE